MPPPCRSWRQQDEVEANTEGRTSEEEEKDLLEFQLDLAVRAAARGAVVVMELAGWDRQSRGLTMREEPRIRSILSSPSGSWRLQQLTARQIRKGDRGAPSVILTNLPEAG